MSLYRPVSIFPNNNDIIDATKDNEFSWQIKGSQCVKYMIKIYNSAGTQVFTTDEVTPVTPFYNNDIITHIIPAGTLTNNANFTWELSLWSDTYDVLVFQNIPGWVHQTGSGGLRWVEISKMHLPTIDNITVGDKLYRRSSSSGNWGSSGIVTSVEDYLGWRIYTDGLSNANLEIQYDFKLMSNKLVVLPRIPIRTASTSSISVAIAEDYPSADFMVTFSHPSDLPVLYYECFLYDENGVLIDKSERQTEPYNRTSTTETILKYTYNGFVSEAKSYRLFINVMDTGNRLFSSTKNFTVNLYGFQGGDELSVRKGFDDNECFDKGYLEVNWSEIKFPPHTDSIDRVIVTREENGNGIFKYIATVTDAAKVRDYSVESGKKYKYRIHMMGSSAPLPMQYNSKEVEYKSNNWFVMSLIETSDPNVLLVDSNNIWVFQSAETQPNVQNINSTVYNPLSAFPKFSVGKNNYISSSLSCYLTGVFNDFYENDLDKLKRWREFCAKNTMKLVKHPNGENFICKLSDFSSESDFSSYSYPTKVSFSYTEIKKNDVTIVG